MIPLPSPVSRDGGHPRQKGGIPMEPKKKVSSKKLLWLFLLAILIVIPFLLLPYLLENRQVQQRVQDYRLAVLETEQTAAQAMVDGLGYWQEDDRLLAERTISFGTYLPQEQQLPVTVSVRPRTPADEAILTLNGVQVPMEPAGETFQATFPLSLHQQGEITGVTFRAEGREETAVVHWVADPKGQLVPCFYSNCDYLASKTVQMTKDETAYTGRITFAACCFPSQAGKLEEATLLIYRNNDLETQKALSFRQTHFRESDAVLVSSQLHGAVPKDGAMTCVFEATDSNGFRYRHTALTQKDGPVSMDPADVTQVFDPSGQPLFDCPTGHTWE